MQKNNAYFSALVSNAGSLYVNGNYPLFAAGMAGDIQRYITEAFYVGASACGFLPDELIANDLSELNAIIQNEFSFVSRLATAILDLRDNDLPITRIYPRLEVWTNRYQDVVNRAQVLLCGDQKLKWILGPNEQHCSSCSRLDGKVKRASEWEASGLHPQSPPNERLTCQGWRCLCTLEPTTEPLSRGPLPTS